MSDIDQQREQWETFTALLKAGCSIPYELRHVERRYWEGVHRMVGKPTYPMPETAPEAP